MAAVQQEPKTGQEPNASSTPKRRRDTRAILAIIAVLILVALVAMALHSREPGAGMGGHVSNENSATRPS